MAISKALIIPAAGSGIRMQKKIPKPYLKLDGHSILEHTLRAFLSLEGLQKIAIAADEDYLDEVHRLLDAILPDAIDGIAVPGGTKRQNSIRNALEHINDTELVLVHDAVRPFVKMEHVVLCCRTASETDAAVLGIPAQDTIKKVDDRQIVQKTTPRSQMWQAQTPQVFKTELLRQAYAWAKEKGFTGTDDASLVEHFGKSVQMVKGDPMNIKITYPLDLELAKIIIAREF